ncbi:MAG TPA: quinolinate synthase NadA [Bdellovibrionota bacterium]|nr:quinolinate synthase NadA [Bdellovibrionota bacterium]
MGLPLDYFQPVPPRHLDRTGIERDNRLVEEIQALKREKGAFVLCHNYQKPEVHRVADAVGDSYGLSVAAKKAACDIIVFCGVRFMAETAHILNPSKKVLLPEEMAGCGLADTITGDDVRAWKARYPGKPVVMYINCSADVKAESDAICTSSNALHVVESIEGDPVLFGPDANLANYVKQKAKKTVIPWDGYCPVHRAVTREMLEKTLELFPDAVVIVHPECNPDVVDLADEVLSTSQMLEAIQRRPEKKFVVGTEIGLIQKAQELCPDKEIHPIYRHKSCDQSCACPYMKVTGLRSVLRSLQNETCVITVPEETRLRALRAVNKMLEIGLPKPQS